MRPLLLFYVHTKRTQMTNMNQTTKYVRDLKRGDVIRPHMDSADLTVVSLSTSEDSKPSNPRIAVKYLYRGEYETIVYNADTPICVIE